MVRLAGCIVQFSVKKKRLNKTFKEICCVSLSWYYGAIQYQKKTRDWIGQKWKRMVFGNSLKHSSVLNLSLDEKWIKAPNVESQLYKIMAATSSRWINDKENILLFWLPGGNDDENVFVLNLLLGGPISIERTFLIAESLYIDSQSKQFYIKNNLRCFPWFFGEDSDEEVSLFIWFEGRGHYDVSSWCQFETRSHLSSVDECRHS